MWYNASHKGNYIVSDIEVTIEKEKEEREKEGKTGRERKAKRIKA